MSIRRDEVNLLLTIDGKPAARTLQDMQKQARDLRRSLLRMDVDSEGFKKASKEAAALDTRIKQVLDSTRAVKKETAGGGLLGNLTGFLSGGIRAVPVLGAIVTGFEALRGAFTGASALEQLNISFETFLGNGEKAKQVVQELRQFADVTPFETEQVNAAGRSLLAFGFSAEELIPTLTRVGDVAAGTGKDFNELAQIYGKARTEGLIQNDTLNQLAEAGVPIYTELAKVLQVNESQIRKMAEQGKIQFADLQQAFENLTGEGSKFGGLMERQSKSIGGLYSTLKSSLTNLLTGLGTALAPAIKSILEGLIPAVELLGRIAVPIFNAIGSVISFVVNELTIGFTQTLPNLISRFVQAGESIPILGKGISTLLIPIRLVIDAFESLRATGAGVMAALENIFTTGGYNAGKAYTEARNRALEEERQEAARAAAEAARDDRQLSAKEQAELAAQQKKAAAERAAAQQKAREEAQKRAEAALQVALKAAEVATKREELLLENQRIKGEITEAHYQNRLLEIEAAGLERRLDVFRQFHRLQGVEALEAQNKLEQLERSRASRFVPGQTTDAQPGIGSAAELAGSDPDAAIRERLAIISKSTETEEGVLRDKFVQLRLTEQDYELQRLELKRAALEEEIALLRTATVPQVEEIRKREEEKAKAEEDIAKKRLENKERTAELQRKVEQAGLQATQDVFATAIELLGQDEKARKKNAGAIKAYQTAQVIVQGIAEVQKIWAGAAELGPIAGPIIGTIQTAVAVARTGLAISKINATKFAGGGYTPSGFGIAPDSTGHRPVGVVHNDEWVSPAWMTKHPVHGAQIAALESVRQRGFANGGFATTPTVNIVPGAAAGSAAAVSMEGMAMMADEFRQFRNEVRAWQGRIRVAYTDIEDVGGEVNSVRVEASL